jgi:Tfp pilus assembly protein PilF
MRIAAAVLTAALVAVSALAVTARASPPAAPPPPKQPIDALFNELKQASTPDDAKPIEAQIGMLFLQSGSPSVDVLMTRGTAALAAGDNDTARKLFDSVTGIAPDYAEGWHERAELQVAANDDSGAMVSLEHAIALNPREFRAMSELAGMLEDYGDKPGALKLYRRALALDPQLDGVDRHVKALENQVEGQGI